MPSALVRVLSSPALMLYGVRRGGALLVDLAPGDLLSSTATSCVRCPDAAATWGSGRLPPRLKPSALVRVLSSPALMVLVDGVARRVLHLVKHLDKRFLFG